DDAPPMLGDLRVGDFAAQRAQSRVRAFLVRAHQPRIARDIRGQHRRQPVLDALSPGVHGRDATAISPVYHSLIGAARARTASLWPILCAVINAHDFDGCRLDPINDDEGKWRDHELASASYPTLTATIGESLQIGTSLVNGVGNSPGGLRI